MLYYIYIFTCLSVWLFMRLTVSLLYSCLCVGSVCLSVYMSVSVSLCLHVCLSVCRLIFYLFFFFLFSILFYTVNNFHQINNYHTRLWQSTWSPDMTLFTGQFTESFGASLCCFCSCKKWQTLPKANNINNRHENVQTYTFSNNDDFESKRLPVTNSNDDSLQNDNKNVVMTTVTLLHSLNRQLKLIIVKITEQHQRMFSKY